VARNRPVDRLVLITPYDSIANVAWSRYFFVPVPWLIRDSFDSAKMAPDISVPTLLLVAERDEVMPRAGLDNLVRSFSKTIPRVVIVPEASHNTIDESPVYAEELAKFLR
jgi:pimeloyl-ACP methyl ester carboxylesterase